MTRDQIITRLKDAIDSGKDREITHIRVVQIESGYFATGLYSGDALDEDDFNLDDGAECKSLGVLPGSTNAFGPARVEAQRVASILGLPYCE